MACTRGLEQVFGMLQCFICSSAAEFGKTYDALRNGLADGVDLRCVTTTTYAHSDVDVGCVKLLVMILVLQ